MQFQLDFDSGKVKITNHTQLKFEVATHLLCRGWLCGVFKRQKLATGFSKESLCHLRTRN